MLLINGEINLIFTWSDDWLISSPIGATKFKITDTKLQVAVVTLSPQDNEKLLPQLKSCFKRTVNWNEYQPKVSPERRNKYLNFLIDPSFHKVKRLFALSFENEEDRKLHTGGYYIPKAEIKY